MAGRVRRAPDGTPLVAWGAWLHPLDKERFEANASRVGLSPAAYFRKRCIEEETPRKSAISTLDRKAMAQAVAVLDVTLERLTAVEAVGAVLDAAVDECREAIHAVVRALGIRR